MIVMVRDATTLGAAAEASPPKRLIEEARFESVYRATARPLWAYVAKITGDPSLADDILQRAFLQLLRTPLDETGDDRVRAWLFTVATNLVRDHWRQNRRQQSVPLPHTVHDPGDHDVALRRDMEKVFHQLKPQERMLLWLAHVEESSHEEIALAAGVREKSVRVLLFRARRKLGALLRKRGLAPEGIR